MPLLYWLTRDDDIHAATQTPYRLLEEVREFSRGDRDTSNMLIQGDNLDALKALLPYYAGKVKCIFIDPPYNTRSAFEHYDDNLEHTKWLAMMYPRLEMLRELLAEDGSIWVTIDDNEAHYLKVIMDEVFGRKNFVANCVWQKKYAVANDHKTIAPMHDHILVYRKSELWKRGLLERTEENNSQYRMSDEKGVFRADNYTCGKTSEERPNLYYAVTQPNTGEKIWPKKTAVWRYSPDKHKFNVENNLVYWGKDGNSKVPAYKRYLHALKNEGKIIPQTLWFYDFAGHTDAARKEARIVLDATSLTNDFITPKPELLISRILQIASNPGDLVLDSFLGSGTTAAVAHKMRRRYVGIEMGDHAMTHCAPRLQKVIEGEQGGISEAVGWKGGGGFRFYRLGIPVFDENGHVSEGIKFAPLAAHLWFLETGIPFSGRAKSPFLGSHEGVGYYLLYNGILGDKSANGGNVLTAKVLSGLPSHDGVKVIFGEGCRLSAERLNREGITFRQIPYEIKAR